MRLPNASFCHFDLQPIFFKLIDFDLTASSSTKCPLRFSARYQTILRCQPSASYLFLPVNNHMWTIDQISPVPTNVLFATKHSTALNTRRDTFEPILERSRTPANSQAAQNALVGPTNSLDTRGFTITRTQGEATRRSRLSSKQLIVELCRKISLPCRQCCRPRARTSPALHPRLLSGHQTCHRRTPLRHTTQ